MTSKDKLRQQWRMIVETADTGDVAVVAVEGRIGHVSAPRLAAALDEVLAKGALKVAVDLEAVDYLGSAGLIVLDKLARRLEALQGGVMVYAPAGPVLLALNLAGWGDRSASASSRAGAVAVLQELRRKPAGGQEASAGERSN